MDHLESHHWLQLLIATGQHLLARWHLVAILIDVVVLQRQGIHLSKSIGVLHIQRGHSSRVLVIMLLGTDVVDPIRCLRLNVDVRIDPGGIAVQWLCLR